LFAVFLRLRCFGFSLNSDIYIGSFLESYFFAVLVLQRVLNANFSVEVVGTFDGDFYFLRFAWMGRLNNFSGSSGHRSFWFPLLLHKATSEDRKAPTILGLP